LTLQRKPNIITILDKIFLINDEGFPNRIAIYLLDAEKWEGGSHPHHLPLSLPIRVDINIDIFRKNQIANSGC